MVLVDEGARAGALLLFGLGFLGLGTLLGALWDGIKWLAGKAADLGILLAHAALQAGHQIWNALKSLSGYAKRFGVWIKDRVVQLWQLKIQPLIKSVVSFLLKIQDWLRRHFQFLIRALGKLHEWLAYAWNHIVAPILTAIEVFRRVFQLLAQLGVGWAAKVDGWLANLENKIYSAFRFLQGIVNQFSEWLDLLFTPDGLLRGILLISSLDRVSGALVRVLIRKGTLGFPSGDRELYAARFPTSYAEQTIARLGYSRLQDDPGAALAMSTFLDLKERSGH